MECHSGVLVAEIWRVGLVGTGVYWLGCSQPQVKIKLTQLSLSQPSRARVTLPWLCSLLILHRAVSQCLPVYRLRMQTVPHANSRKQSCFSWGSVSWQGSHSQGSCGRRPSVFSLLEFYQCSFLNQPLARAGWSQWWVGGKDREPEPQRGPTGHDRDQRSCWWAASALHWEFRSWNPGTSQGARQLWWMAR